MSEEVNTGRTDNIERLLEEQLAVMRRQLRVSRVLMAVAALAAAALLIAVVLIVPPAVQSLQSADRLLKGLEDADLTEMVENINGLTKDSQEELSRTADKLDELDVDSLNKAIQNLENATRPLAGLFGGQ